LIALSGAGRKVHDGALQHLGELLSIAFHAGRFARRGGTHFVDLAAIGGARRDGELLGIEKIPGVAGPDADDITPLAQLDYFVGQDYFHHGFRFLLPAVQARPRNFSPARAVIRAEALISREWQ
jgi:hypothetical protein